MQKAIMSVCSKRYIIPGGAYTDTFRTDSMIKKD